VEISEGLLCQGVKAAGRCILLDLPIPGIRIELGKPGTESRQLFGRELADSVFKMLNGTYDIIVLF
jgi:hypothetical protein